MLAGGVGKSIGAQPDERRGRGRKSCAEIGSVVGTGSRTVATANRTRSYKKRQREDSPRRNTQTKLPFYYERSFPKATRRSNSGQLLAGCGARAANMNTCCLTSAI